jgi:hypothetical protein
MTRRNIHKHRALRVVTSEFLADQKLRAWTRATLRRDFREYLERGRLELLQRPRLRVEKYNRGRYVVGMEARAIKRYHTPLVVIAHLKDQSRLPSLVEW